MARERSSAVVDALRAALTGAAVRAIAGMRDVGEAFLAKVGAVDGGDHLDTDGDADVWVHYEDALSGMPGVARLFVPGNILFAVPDEDDTAMVVRGRDAHGPGAPYLLHGDAGDATRVPGWLRQKVGLFTKKVLRLESSQADVEVQAGSGHNVVLNGGTLRLARVTDRVRVGVLTGTAGPYPVNFVFQPLDADGNPAGPPVTGTSVTISGVVSNEDGALHAVG